MKTSFISSYGTSQAVRTQLLKMQIELVKKEKEVVSGRAADAGLHLGARTGQSVSLERDIDRLKGVMDSNELVLSRLSATQAGLTTLTETAQTFQSTMTAASSGAVEPTILLSEAKTALVKMTGVLNSSLNGENLFAGINTDVQPFADFFEAGSPARQAIEDAFVTQFGFAHTDPAAAALTRADLTNFLENVVEPQFTGPDWNTNWSSATDATITARITMTDTSSASVSANEAGIRKLAAAAAYVSVLFEGTLNEYARDGVIAASTSLVGQAVSDLAQTQAKTGIVQQRVTAASERLSMQVDIFSGKVNDLVGIDPYEASTRVQQLLAQIETAYTLTNRMSQLSLVRFLS
ncbi:MAG: flagellar hook-associated family protein [Rhizobiaceae bacterium]|nr:flagellar hook-associated family protein [Rhizobiaceae bacterium]